MKSINNYTPKNCSVQNLIEQSVNLSQIYTNEKDIKITSLIKNEAMINVDENKFLACIINLIKNAAEAIEHKGEILITAECKDKTAKIKVSNNGKPISPTAQKEIFSEGFTTKKTGSGLGLYICKNNLKAQNADLQLTQSTGKKTEFEITIPVI